jgi:hypothetical protein
MKKQHNQFPSHWEVLFSILYEIIYYLKQLAKQKQESPKYYDTADVMRLLKVSESTVCRLRKRGELEYKKVGGKIYYTPTSIDALMNKSDKK